MTKQSLKIGLVQLEVTPMKSDNLRKILDSLDLIGQTCDVVVFPECSMGYPNGKTRRSMIADPLGVKVLDLGYGEPVGQHEIYDSVVTEARGKIPVPQQSHNLCDAPCRRL